MNEQTISNDINLLKKSACQFCGCTFDEDILDCSLLYHKGLAFLDLSDKKHQLYRFLSVDAFALQHAECQDGLSNYFHFSRLHLILSMKMDWDYSLSPSLQAYLKRIQHLNQIPPLNIPSALNRGHLTVKGFSRVKDAPTCLQFIQSWAQTVYQSYNSNELVKKLAEEFLRDAR